MSEKVIHLTGLHALKSERRFDYARTDNATHLMIDFAEYEQSEWREEWTGRSWTCIVPVEEIREMLTDRMEERFTEVRCD